jgi:hypothetical protein
VPRRPLKTAIVDPIATRDFVLTKPSGETVPIVLVVGRPFQVGKSESRCPIRIDGLAVQYNDISGGDTFQALCLALKFLKDRLDEQIEGGCRLTDHGYKSAYEPHELAAVFGVAAVYPVQVPEKQRSPRSPGKKT